MKIVCQLRPKIKQDEDSQARGLNTFLKGWWKDREDRLVKEIFRSLKKKQTQELISRLRKKDGDLVASDALAGDT